MERLDPARIILHYDLIQKNDLIKYMLKTSLENEERQKKAGGGITPMMAYNGPPLDHIEITALERTSTSLVLTVAYRWTAGDPTNSYTNNFEFFGCTNLLDSWYMNLGTANVSSTTNWIEWSAPDFTNIPLRFIRACNADQDVDGDGLTDAREICMYHSSWTNSDTDGDTLSDYEEAINLNTDPSNPHTNKPVVTITFPTNNYRWVWMP